LGKAYGQGEEESGKRSGRSGTQATCKKVDGSKGTTRGSAEGPIEEEKK
jgi:hypothetical protein